MLKRSGGVDVLPQLHANGKVKASLHVPALSACKLASLSDMFQATDTSDRGLLLQFIGDIATIQDLEDHGELEDALQLPDPSILG